MFPDLDIVHHGAWVETASGLFSGIYVNGHPGVLTEDDVYAALEAGRLVAEADVTFGGIEPLTIDGRRGWGWTERLETPELGVDWVAYRAVVPYDTISYAIEFYGNDPGLKRTAPDTLRTIVTSFAVGELKWNWPLILILSGITVLMVGMAKNRTRARSLRLQSITLRQVKKGAPVEEVEDRQPEAGDGGSPSGGGSGPP
jgi:hypothetical protein